jgi:hypothetical protein
VAASTGQHEHRGRRAVQRLVEYAPASGSLALWVAHRDVSDDEALAHAAGRLPAYTDGRCIHYTPAFDKLGLDAQTGWVAHELLHVALRHGPRFRALQRRLGDADLALFNRCADAIVNSTLAPAPWLALPPKALTLPMLLDQVLATTRSDEAALLEWDVERLYAAVDDRRSDGKASARKDGPRAATLRAKSVAICTWRSSGNMSGNSRACSRAGGSILRAAACSAALVRTPLKPPSSCLKTGTEAS